MNVHDMTAEQAKEACEQRLANWEYCGIKGSDLMQKYPYLMKYPPIIRKKKMQKLAASDMKDAITLRVLNKACSPKVEPD